MEEEIEILEIVNKDGNVIGRAPRNILHGNNKLLHRVVHVFVLNSKDEILLQKRSVNKDVAPGKWDTSVGGHVSLGETIPEALQREAKEEIGVSCRNAEFLYKYIHKNVYESELVHTYQCLHQGPFEFNKEEIDDLKFWTFSDIQKNIGKGIFSDNFEDEFSRYFTKKT